MSFVEYDILLREIFQKSPVCNNHLENYSNEGVSVLEKFGYITIKDGMNHLVITITPFGADFFNNGGFENLENKKSDGDEMKQMQSELNRLQAENLRLQNEELKYQQSVKTWKVVSFVISLIAAVLAVFKSCSL